MKKQITAWAIAACAILAMASCGTSQTTVAYKEANHYFVRNDAPDHSPRLIQTRAEFERYFGAAAVMGNDGLPTEIDFDKHNVVALIEPQTNIDTDIKVKSVKTDHGQLTVTYEVRQSGQPRSYSTVPMILLRIDKKYGNNVRFVKQ